jgi:hypothetical protein
MQFPTQKYSKSLLFAVYHSSICEPGVKTFTSLLFLVPIIHHVACFKNNPSIRIEFVIPHTEYRDPVSDVLK